MYDMMTNSVATEMGISRNAEVLITEGSVTCGGSPLGLQETIASTIGIITFADTAPSQMTVLSISDPEPWSKWVHDGIRLPPMTQDMAGWRVENDIFNSHWR